MSTILATTLCALFLAGSVITFGAAACLVRRARRAELAALDTFERADRARTAAKRAKAEAERIHARCNPPGVTAPAPVRGPINVLGPLGVVRRGVA